MPDLECPAGKKAWRQDLDGPMPLLVPEPQLEWWRQRYPDLWIDIMPEGLPRGEPARRCHLMGRES